MRMALTPGRAATSFALATASCVELEVAPATIGTRPATTSIVTDVYKRQVNQHAFGDLDVAEVFGDFRRVVHGAADEADLPAVLARHIDGQLDAVNGGRETRDK